MFLIRIGMQQALPTTVPCPGLKMISCSKGNLSTALRDLHVPLVILFKDASIQMPQNDLWFQEQAWSLLIGHTEDGS